MFIGIIFTILIVPFKGKVPSGLVSSQASKVHVKSMYVLGICKS